MVNKAIEELFLEALARGHTLASAAALVGVSQGWHYERVKSDPEWIKKTEHWQAKAVDKAILAMTSAFDKDWKAAESFLKRRAKKEWGDHQVVENTGEQQRFRVEIVDNHRNPHLKKDDKQG